MVKLTDRQKAKLLEWAGWLDITSLIQGTGSLRDNEERYCCLGVYVVNAHPRKRWKLLPCYANMSYTLWTGNEWEASFLPKGMQKELGLDQIMYKTMYEGGMTLQQCFSEMNDTLQLPFSAIATQIRYLVEHGEFEREIAKKLDPESTILTYDMK